MTRRPGRRGWRPPPRRAATGPALPELAGNSGRPDAAGLSRADATALAALLPTRADRVLYERAMAGLSAREPQRQRAIRQLAALGARASAPLLAAALGREPDAGQGDAARGAGALRRALRRRPGGARAGRPAPRGPCRGAGAAGGGGAAGGAAAPGPAAGNPSPAMVRRRAVLLGFARGAGGRGGAGRRPARRRPRGGPRPPRRSRAGPATPRAGPWEGLPPDGRAPRPVTRGRGRRGPRRVPAPRWRCWPRRRRPAAAAARSRRRCSWSCAARCVAGPPRKGQVCGAPAARIDAALDGAGRARGGGPARPTLVHASVRPMENVHYSVRRLRRESVGATPRQVEVALGKRDAYGPEVLAARQAEEAGPGADHGPRPVLPNFKGGTRKTSLSTSYAYRLAERGYRVLVVDLDSQGHATMPRPRRRGQGHALRRARPQAAHLRGDGPHPPCPTSTWSPANLAMSTIDLSLMPTWRGASSGSPRRWRRPAPTTTSWCSTRAPIGSRLLNLNALMAATT